METLQVMFAIGTLLFEIWGELLVLSTSRQFSTVTARAKKPWSRRRGTRGAAM
jgi:hypothetical protein